MSLRYWKYADSFCRCLANQATPGPRAGLLLVSIQGVDINEILFRRTRQEL